MKTMIDYQKQGVDFLKNTGTKITVTYLEYGPHFFGDKESRHRFLVTFSRNSQCMSVRFGQSIAAGDSDPTAYEVLACLTKNDPGTFEDFCGDYGYDTDSIKAHKTYKAVMREWKAVERVFGDVLSDLSEIQ